MNIKTFSRQTIKSIFILAIAASLFACQGESSAQTPLSDSNYTLLNTPLDISSGDKVEVAELFWYGCGHCFSLEPQVNKWKKDLPENASFVNRALDGTQALGDEHVVDPGDLSPHVQTHQDDGSEDAHAVDGDVHTEPRYGGQDRAASRLRPCSLGHSRPSCLST